MTAGSVNLTRLMADEQSAPTSERCITLADGTTIAHAVGAISWQDRARLADAGTHRWAEDL